MCGIVARVDGGDAREGVKLLEERGPHGTATWRDGDVSLGLARLAIVAPNEEARVHIAGGAPAPGGAPGLVPGERTPGTSPGAPPRGPGAPPCAAVMNGELYEHRALRRALGVDGAGSDQALLPVLFAKGGVQAIVDTRSPVTCAIADVQERSVTLLRDRFGKRPLYVDDNVRAASEMKALLAMRSRSPLRFARDAVARFVSRGILEDNAPIVSGIESVAPGTARTLGMTTGERNLTLPGDKPRGSISLLETLRAACARRLRDLEVPAAVLLSGGLDSSVIAALSREHVGVAYTMRIRSSDTSDESDKARAMADALRLELRIVDVEPPTFSDLAACAWRLETPDAFISFGLAHAYATLAKRLRADGVRVVVTGEGADELFLGYAWHRAQAAAQNGWPMPKHLGIDERAWMAASMVSSRNTRALEVFLRARFGDVVQARALESLVNVDVLDAKNAGQAPDPQTRGANVIGAERRRHDSLHIDLSMWPLRIADRILMGHGVEPRAPFLDEDVVDSVLATPAREHESAEPSLDKPVLRAIARDVLPRDVDVVLKQGFAAWSWPGAETTRAWATRLANEGTLLARAEALRNLSSAQDDASALLAWRLVVLEVTARQLDAARAGSRWQP